MNNQIENLINYLLDTETTSEISLIENIHKNNDLFQLRYIKDWKLVVLRKLEQIHPNAIVPTLINVNNDQKSNSETLDEQDSSSEDDDEENKYQTYHIYHSNKTIDIYVDIVRQCQRLLWLLYHCQQSYAHFIELYYSVLEQCSKSDNEKLITVVLQQIATHLFESTDNNNGDSQCIIKFVPPNTLSSNTPLLHEYILTTIQTLCSTNQTERHTFSFLSNHIDILYPYTTRFLDVRPEFRDTMHYFIDGDSLLLSIAHQTNVNINSVFGNTLHVIYLIERLLLTLFRQSHQCNYTLVFFDCHHHLYQQTNSILSLLRSCLIAHLCKNTDKCGTTRVQKFSSWLDGNYLKFVGDEKPMFIFYHDMSSFSLENDYLLSKPVLENLLCMYRLFGNYHQYVIQCQLYLMNKLFLTETTIKCFQVQFNRICPKNLLETIIKTVPSNYYINEIEAEYSNELIKLCQDISENDIRLFVYLKTLINFIQENKEQYLVENLSPLLVLHVALLIRLSLCDRHLPASLPSITFSPAFSQFVGQFQHRLASFLSSSPSFLSWSKISDIFDGRLLTFTIYQISQFLSNIRLDSKTYDIVKGSLDLLNISLTENLFKDIMNKLVQSNDIILPLSPSESQVSLNNPEQKRHKIIRISNPLIDEYLKPILTASDKSTFDLINPDYSYLVRHE
ncbi:unnamed protein product, partial [Rotaria sp. Silwood1]